MDAPPQRVDDDDPRRAMRGKTPARLEPEQHHPQPSLVKDRDLPMLVGRLVRLATQRLDRRPEIDAVLRPGEPLGRGWTEPILGRRHVVPRVWLHDILAQCRSRARSCSAHCRRSSTTPRYPQFFATSMILKSFRRGLVFFDGDAPTHRLTRSRVTV